jgi:DNA-binding response OmpR family regulator
MSAVAVRILVVGTSTASIDSTLKGLARAGWESHLVKTVREADTVLRTIRFQLILASEKLPDGTGYELASLVAQQTGNLFIAVPLSETCLWLPAVENGVRSLGERALNPLLLKTEAESILRGCDTAIVAPDSKRSGRRSSSGDVVRAEALLQGGAAQVNSAERFGQEAHERFEHGDYVISKGSIVPRRRELTFAETSREHASRLVSEDVVRDFGVLGKRWRGL